MSDVTPIKLVASYWWIDRWRKSSAYSDMSLAEQGAYRNLCDEVWLRPNGVIPEGSLAKVSGDAVAWPSVSEKVLKWMTRVDGGWTNDTAKEVMRTSRLMAEKQKRYRQRKQTPTERTIADRDGLICGICAVSISKPSPYDTDRFVHLTPPSIELDHIIPVSLGGCDCAANRQFAHRECNTKKGNGRYLENIQARHQSLPSSTCSSHYQSNDQCNDQRSPYPSPDITDITKVDSLQVETLLPKAEVTAIAVVTFWNRQAIDDHVNATGGVCSKALAIRITRALKPLIEKVQKTKACSFDEAWLSVRPYWQMFCQSDAVKFGPEKFAENPRQVLPKRNKLQEAIASSTRKFLEDD